MPSNQAIELPVDGVVVWDDFSDGFSTSGPAARWTVVAGGGHVADDGVVSTSDQGLHVVSRGTSPVSGEPAFTQTVPSEGDDPAGLNGAGDHAKFIVYANHLASSGLPGFDAVPGTELSFEATISGRVFGGAGHPFGDAVVDPDGDLRLGAVMLNTIDPETSTAFDFLLTNKHVHIFYGRPHFAREQLGNYASFANTIPVADRHPTDEHHVKISYQADRGLVRWFLEGEEVLRVDRIGHRLSRSTLVLDEGGEEAAVRPRQISPGFGMMSLLDGALPGRPGLVRLSSRNTYFRPEVGEPHALSFTDEVSRESSRLFGQGAELTVSRYVVSTVPVP